MSKLCDANKIILDKNAKHGRLKMCCIWVWEEISVTRIA